jgi:hypothetical protein
MKKQTITLDTDGHDHPRVSALVEGGLAVHRDRDGERWAVTHVDSGTCVVRVRLRSQAIAVVKEILPVTNWYDDEDILKAKKMGIVPAIRTAVAAATKGDKE